MNQVLLISKFIILFIFIGILSVSGNNNISIIEDNSIDSLTLNISSRLIPNSPDTGLASDSTKIKYWKKGGVGNILFSQLYLSHWAEGGESTLTGLGDFSFFTKYAKGKETWDNTLDFKYGLLKTGDYDFRKNEDKLELNSKFGQKAIDNFYYSVMVNLKTQVMTGFEYPNDSVAVSDFLSPGYLVFAIGMDYKPFENFSLLLSPLTLKSTYVLNDSIDATKFGLEESTNSKHEPGAYIKIQSKIDITENIDLVNKIDLFTNYVQNPQNIDVNWETILTLKINSHIKTVINTRLIYDDDIKIPIERTIINDLGVEETVMGSTKKIQFKEMLSVGFSYHF